MLLPELDVLRNKDLTFGCIVYDEQHYFFGQKTLEEMRLVSKSPEFYETDGIYFTHYRGDPAVNISLSDINNPEKFTIAGYPLTRGRIEHLVDIDNKEHIKIKNEIYFDLFDYGMLDKTEIERMQHDKWSELYPLLVEFSTYFKHE